MNGFRIFAFREPFWFLFAGNFCLWESSLLVENFLNQRKKNYVENFLVCGKFPSLWKISLFKENFLDCGKIPWSSKIALTTEKFLDQEIFLDCGKLTFLTAKKIIGLVTLKTNANFETIKNIFWV